MELLGLWLVQPVVRCPVSMLALHGEHGLRAAMDWKWFKSLRADVVAGQPVQVTTAFRSPRERTWRERFGTLQTGIKLQRSCPAVHG